MDVHGRRSTLGSETPTSKLDMSLNESNIGHRKNISRIPKLNLEILPNYHGKSNSSMNQ